MLRFILSTVAGSLLLAGSVMAGPVSTSSSTPARLEPVEADPFGALAPAATSSRAPAAVTAPDPAPSPAVSATQTAETSPAPKATTSALHLGPYARLSGLVVQDPSFGVVGPIGALVRLEGGLEVAPFGAAQGLAFEAGLGIGFTADTALERVEAQLVVTSFQVSAVYRQPIVSMLGVYGRVTGAANVAHLRLARGAFEKEIDQTAFDGALGGTAGLELAIPLGYTPQGSGGRSVDNYLSFFVEAGYEAHTTLSFDDARRDVDADTEPARIPVSGQPLGDLDLSGWLWRFGGAFRF